MRTSRFGIAFIIGAALVVSGERQAPAQSAPVRTQLVVGTAHVDQCVGQGQISPRGVSVSRQGAAWHVVLTSTGVTLHCPQSSDIPGGRQTPQDEPGATIKCDLKTASLEDALAIKAQAFDPTTAVIVCGGTIGAPDSSGVLLISKDLTGVVPSDFHIDSI
jgi:hypothetical protein